MVFLLMLAFFVKMARTETYTFTLTKQVGTITEEMVVTVSGIQLIGTVCPGGATTGEKQSYIYRRTNPWVDISAHVYCLVKGGGCNSGSYQYGLFCNWTQQVVRFTGQPNCGSYPAFQTYTIQKDLVEQSSGTLDYSYEYHGKNTIGLSFQYLLRDFLPCPPNTQGSVYFLLLLVPEFTPEEAMLTAQNNPDPDRPDMAYWDDKNCNSCSHMGLPRYRINTSVFMPSFSDADYRYNDHGHEVKFERYYPASAAFGMFGKGWGLGYETGLRVNSAYSTVGEPSTVNWLHPDGKDENFINVGSWLKPFSGNYRDSLVFDTAASRYVLHEFTSGLRYYFGQSSQSALWFPLEKIMTPDSMTLVTIDRDTDDRITKVTDFSGRQTTFSFNAQRQCTTMTVPDGRTCTFTYNSSGRMSGGTDLLGNVIEYTYTPEGYIATMKVNNATASFTYGHYAYNNIIPCISSITNLDGKTTTFTLNHLTGTFSASDPGGSGLANDYNMNILTGSNTGVSSGGIAHTKEYNEHGMLTKITNNLGASRIFEYDAQKNMVKYTSEESVSVRFGYDNAGRVTSFTDAKNRTNTYDLDARGHLVHILGSDNTHRYFTYDGNGLLTSYKNQLGQVEKFSYDATGNLIRYEDPTGHVTAREYNPLTSLLTKEITPLGTSKTYQYDGLDRMTRVTLEDGKTKELLYDCCSQTGFQNEAGMTATYARNAVLGITTLTDMDGQSTTVNYDEKNRIAEVIYPATGKSQAKKSFTYTPFDKYASITDENGKTSYRTYDAAGNLHILKDENGNDIYFSRTPGGRIENIAAPHQPAGISRFYDQNGRLNRIRNARVEDVFISRDSMDRFVGVTSDKVTSHFTYDDAGMVSSYAGTHGNTQISRNASGKITSVSYPGFSPSAITHDANGNITGYTFPGGTLSVKYLYDARDRMTAMVINNTDSVVHTLDETGLIVKTRYPNQIESSFSFDPNGSVEAINHTRGGNAIISFEFTRDAMGNIIKESRILPAGTGGTIIPADTGGVFRSGNLITQWQGNTYENDADGNLSSIVGSNNCTFTHNSVNLLTAMNMDGTGITFQYDSRGFIDSKKTVNEDFIFLYDHLGRLILRKEANSGSTDYFIWDDRTLVAMQNSTGTYYYLYNQVGSTMGLTDNNGNLVNVYNYNLWGKLTYQQETVSQPFKFCGALGVREEFPDYYCMKQRFYNAHLGRFIEADPSGYAQGNNLYVYAGNNPQLYVDPQGLFKTDFYHQQRMNDRRDNKPVDPHQLVRELDNFATVCDVVSNWIPGAGVGTYWADYLEGKASGAEAAGNILKSYFTDVLFSAMGGKTGEKIFEKMGRLYGDNAANAFKTYTEFMDNANALNGSADALISPGSNGAEGAESMDFDYGGVKNGTVILE